ncbi:hypothetical protein M231_01202 [Tremella mesenterica]|uniref:Uncharacterized protein n=1 Tax=Tremella mesenterica TaxID=5217 RepID=A0A4Q1BTT0_TREME|nr:hypothetical protein M231_01202 [Tremella mesenterica]
MPTRSDNIPTYNLSSNGRPVTLSIALPHEDGKFPTSLLMIQYKDTGFMTTAIRWVMPQGRVVPRCSPEELGCTDDVEQYKSTTAQMTSALTEAYKRKDFKMSEALRYALLITHLVASHNPDAHISALAGTYIREHQEGVETCIDRSPFDYNTQDLLDFEKQLESFFKNKKQQSKYGSSSQMTPRTLLPLPGSTNRGHPNAGTKQGKKRKYLVSKHGDKLLQLDPPSEPPRRECPTVLEITSTVINAATQVSRTVLVISCWLYSQAPSSKSLVSLPLSWIMQQQSIERIRDEDKPPSRTFKSKKGKRVPAINSVGSFGHNTTSEPSGCAKGGPDVFLIKKSTDMSEYESGQPSPGQRLALVESAHTVIDTNYGERQTQSDHGSTCGPQEDSRDDGYVAAKGTVHHPEPGTVSMSEQNGLLLAPESHAYQKPLKSSGIDFESPSPGPFLSRARSFESLLALKQLGKGRGRRNTFSNFDTVKVDSSVLPVHLDLEPEDGGNLRSVGGGIGETTYDEVTLCSSGVLGEEMYSKGSDTVGEMGVSALGNIGRYFIWAQYNPDVAVRRESTESFQVWKGAIGMVEHCDPVTLRRLSLEQKSVADWAETTRKSRRHFYKIQSSALADNPAKQEGASHLNGPEDRNSLYAASDSPTVDLQMYGLTSSNLPSINKQKLLQALWDTSIFMASPLREIYMRAKWVRTEVLRLLRASHQISMDQTRVESLAPSPSCLGVTRPYPNNNASHYLDEVPSSIAAFPDNISNISKRQIKKHQHELIENCKAGVATLYWGVVNLDYELPSSHLTRNQSSLHPEMDCTTSSEPEESRTTKKADKAASPTVGEENNEQDQCGPDSDTSSLPKYEFTQSTIPTSSSFFPAGGHPKCTSEDLDDNRPRSFGQARPGAEKEDSVTLQRSGTALSTLYRMEGRRSETDLSTSPRVEDHSDQPDTPPENRVTRRWSHCGVIDRT